MSSLWPNASIVNSFFFSQAFFFKAVNYLCLPKRQKGFESLWPVPWLVWLGIPYL